MIRTRRIKMEYPKDILYVFNHYLPEVGIHWYGSSTDSMYNHNYLAVSFHENGHKIPGQLRCDKWHNPRYNSFDALSFKNDSFPIFLHNRKKFLRKLENKAKKEAKKAAEALATECNG